MRVRVRLFQTPAAFVLIAPALGYAAGRPGLKPRWRAARA